MGENGWPYLVFNSLVYFTMKTLALIFISTLIFLGYWSAASLSFPSGLTWTFPGIDQNYSLVDFNIQNGFGWVFLWRDNKVLSTPQDLVLWTDSITWCTEQLQWLYYNNQRGFRLWPLDQNTLTGMQALDSSYNALTLTWWLFTNCNGSGVSSDEVYGAIGHIRWWATYWLLWGVEFDFANKIWVNNFSGSLIKYGNSATWRIFDSQGAIGQLLSNSRRDLCPDGDFTDSYYDWECGTPPPVCGNDIVETWEECDGSSNCRSNCTRRSSSSSSPDPDFCPEWDYSSSYYDNKCGTPPEHGAPIVELIGKACVYDDADYLGNGPFTDTVNHRWYPYAEIMRVSCMHRGRWVWQGLWIYEPDSGITRAEILKTIVKILGVELEDFTIQSEDSNYPFAVQFADVPQDHWFAWYANYALNKWLVSWMAEMSNGQRYLNPDQPATRYEAIQAMMTAYNLINNDIINTNEPSVLGDIIDPSNPYYQSVRQAETLGFISWVPQNDGGYDFEWIRNITRSEFAKIVSVPFTKQLFDIDEVVLNSQLYKIVVQAVNKASGDKFVFINTLVEKLDAIDDYTFIMDFKIQKELFLDSLEELLIKPLVEVELAEENN